MPMLLIIFMESLIKLNYIYYFHGIVNKVKLIEHQILVDQELSGYISLADKVQYLRYFKSFDAHESIFAWKWSIFDQDIQVLAPNTYQTTFPITSTLAPAIAQSSQSSSQWHKFNFFEPSF